MTTELTKYNLSYVLYYNVIVGCTVKTQFDSMKS